MKKKYLLGFLITAIILSAGILQADEFCNLELVDVWKCDLTESISIWNTGLVLHAGYLYVPWRDHMYILEPSDSGTLELEMEALDVSSPMIGDIKVRNNLAYVSLASRIIIYDVSDPLDFDSLGSCSVRYTNQIFLMDTLLIAAANGIHVINIADSTNPTYVKHFGLPLHRYYLPVVAEEIYPYVLVPGLRTTEEDPWNDWWDAYINVIDITESYSYSPQLNDWYPDRDFQDITALRKIGDYYIGCNLEELAFFYMDTLFSYTELKKEYEIEDFEVPVIYIEALNDSMIIAETQNEFSILDISDTSSIEQLAYYENTDEPQEIFYDIATKDSFLFVLTKIIVNGMNDTLCVYSFKMDLDFSDQCMIQQKPEQFEFETYPNPFNSNCQIKYSMLNNHLPVNIDIFSIDGKIIESYENQPSENIINWDASGRPSGIYLIHLSNGSEISTKKIVFVG